MQTKITARHFDLTPEIRSKAEEEMEGLTRYFENIISAEFILDVERHRRMAELKVKVYKETITGSAESPDLYNSMALCVDKVKEGLKRYKGRLKERKPEEIIGHEAAHTRPKTNPDEVDV
jgi:putative sigma-54 modulation protein